MLERLDRIVDDISGIKTKLIILVGPSGSRKSKLLKQLAERRQARILSVGVALGPELMTIPRNRRHVQAADMLNGLADNFATQGLLLLDNIEILFDRTLQLDPLDLLKRQANARRVIAVWPGELRQTRLSYAKTGHPEHQEYGVDGLVTFTIQ